MRKKIVLFLVMLLFLFKIDNVKADEKKDAVYWNVAITKDEEDITETTISIYNPKKLVFGNTKNKVTQCEKRQDLSRSQDQSVIGCFVGDTLYIQYEGILYLNPDSTGVLSELYELEKIEGLEYVNTSEVINMERLFSNDIVLTSLDLSHFDTSKVENMDSMFAGMDGITNLDLSSFQTSNVTSMSFLFSNTPSLKEVEIGSFDTSKVTHMVAMFENTALQVLDLSHFDTENVIGMSYMFRGSNQLKTIYVGEKWSTESLQYSYDLFSDTESLVGENGTKYDENHRNIDYARVDTPGKPGYFSIKKEVDSNDNTNSNESNENKELLEEEKKENSTFIYLGIGGGAVLLLVFILIFLLRNRKKRKEV